MAVKSFGVNSSGSPVMAEGAGPTALFDAVEAAVAAALAVPDIDTISGATAAITAIGTASAAVETALLAKPVTLLVDGVIAKADIFKTMDAIKAHLNTNNLYT